MKHTKAFVAALLVMALLMAGCAAMAVVLTSPPGEGGPMGHPAPGEHEHRHEHRHQHRWKTIKVVQATCISDGRKVQKCSCGKTQTLTIKRSDKYHVCTDWTIGVPATDHTQGTRWATCSVCGARVEEQFYPEGTLRRKDRGDEVKALKSLLACRGYIDRKKSYIDSFDIATEKAVKRLQEDSGLTADGIAWPQTRALLGHEFGPWEVESVKSDTSIGIKHRTCAICEYTETVEERPSPMYRKGDKDGGSASDGEVRRLQTALNDAGYDCGTPDGVYGMKTMHAVKAFQRDHGMTEDGIAWPGVLKLLGWEIEAEESAQDPNAEHSASADGDWFD